MNKQEFLAQLKSGLAGLPQSDIDERLTFYSEMIDDRTEDGILEEDAVAAVGSIEEITSQIISDASLTKLIQEKIKQQKSLSPITILLIIIGSPIWLSLLISAIAVVISLYISLWTLIISLWAIFGSAASCVLGALIAAVVFTVEGNIPTCLAMFGAGIACAGLSILLFYGCNAATKGAALLTKKIVLGIKNLFIKRGTCNA